MSTPDTAAAGLTWRGAPLPEKGAHLRVTHTQSNGRSFKTRTDTIVVHTVSLAGTVLTINETRHLDSTRLTDRWVLLLAPTPGETDVTPPPAAVVEAGSQLLSELLEKPDGAPDPNPTDLAGMQRRWRWCKEQATIAKKRAESLNVEADQLQQDIVDACIEAGLDAPLALDGRTFYFSPVYQVAYQENDDGERYTHADVIKALKACGLHVGLVGEGYNGNSLRAVLSERDKQGLDLPEELARVLRLVKHPGVRSIAAATKKVAGAQALREFANTRADTEHADAT